jgi:hypothetical protein
VPGARGRALALGAVPVTTAVIGDPPVAAVFAGLDVTAHRSSAAMLDRRHDLELVQAQMSGMRGPIGRPGNPEDVGDLEGGAHPTSAAGRVPTGDHQLLERTGHRAHRLGRHLGVKGGGVEPGVTEQRLDNAHIDPVLEQVRGKTVP